LFADIDEFDRSEAWRGDGAVSMLAWLRERCGISSATARVWAGTSSKVASLPLLTDAFAEGSLSLDAFAPLAAMATPETDAELAEASPDWSVRQIRDLARWKRGATKDAAARRFEHRSLHCNDAQRTIWAAFTDDDYAVAKSSLLNLAARLDRRGAASEGEAGYVPLDQRLYDAQMELYRAGWSGGGGGGGSGGGGWSRGDGGDGGGSGGGPRFRPTVIVHAPLDLLLGIGGDLGANGEGSWSGGGDDSGGGGSVAEIQGVGPVSVEVARRLACDADIILSVEGRDGSILDQGRASRDPSVAQRIEIARRDKGCRFPDCTFVDFTQPHHVVHWTLGGLTDLDNLISLCKRHHNAVHESGWHMEGDANGKMTFIGPHGQVKTSLPSPTWKMSSGRAGKAGRAGPNTGPNTEPRQGPLRR
jgi:hypothetical protein